MKKTMIAIAIGAAALIGGTAANAASADAAKSTTAKPATGGASRPTSVPAEGITTGTGIVTITIPATAYRSYRPHYYNSYGYYGRPHGYYGGGPGISFSFGSGGHRGWY